MTDDTHRIAEKKRSDTHTMRCRKCGWVGSETQVAKFSGHGGRHWCPGKQPDGRNCTCSDWEDIASQFMDGDDGWEGE